MSIFNIPLESINKNTLQSLIDNQVAESQSIEYKEKLPENSDSEKKKFLYDVSSFANASGGDLIYGVKAKDGIPSELCGLQVENTDSEKLRLEDILRNCVKPKIFGISIHPINTEDKKTFIIIRIPRSCSLPHMVKYGKDTKFYCRNSAGKYPVEDVSELRILFGLSETLAERIRNFRIERLSKIITGETPVLMEESPKMILHIVPLSAFDLGKMKDVGAIEVCRGGVLPLACGSSSHRYNLDGVLLFDFVSKSTLADSYVQLFRTGCIEAVTTKIFFKYEGRNLIPAAAYEECVLEEMPNYLNYLKRIEVEPPVCITLSLTGVLGYSMGVQRTWHGSSGHPIDRNDLIVPEIILEDFDAEIDKQMKPIFDAVWNACGYPKSMNYNNEEKWIGKK